MLRIENIESIGAVGAIAQHYANVPCMARTYKATPIRRLGIEKIGASHACYAHAMHVVYLIYI